MVLKRSDFLTIDFTTDFYVFNEEEKIILNHLALDASKDVCCDQLSMGMAISDDMDVVAVLQSTYAKIRDLTVEEWADLQSILPYEVSISDDDFDLADIVSVLDTEQ